MSQMYGLFIKQRVDRIHVLSVEHIVKTFTSLCEDGEMTDLF